MSTGVLVWFGGVEAVWFVILMVSQWAAHRCPAAEDHHHDWCYLTMGARGFERYWDRQCVACGLYD